MGIRRHRYPRGAAAPEGGRGMTMPGAADPDTGEAGMSTDTRVDVFPDGGTKAANGADRRSRDARAAVPVFPSTFLAGLGPFGPWRRNRPIGKGRANLAIRDDAARLDAGFKSLARSMAGAILIAAIGLSWPSGANAYLITQKADLRPPQRVDEDPGRARDPADVLDLSTDHPVIAGIVGRAMLYPHRAGHG